MISTSLVEIIEHESSVDAASVVAEEAAAWLGICALDGSATVALPGGRSPALMLRNLAAHPIKWDRITVTTTDERKVPLDHTLSNMGSVWQAFDGQLGEQATFVPLTDRYAHCAIRIPFDLLVLGMPASPRSKGMRSSGVALPKEVPTRVFCAALPIRFSLTGDCGLLPEISAAQSSRPALWTSCAGTLRRPRVCSTIRTPSCALSMLVCLEKIGPILKRARLGERIGELYGTSAIYAGADHREAA